MKKSILLIVGFMAACGGQSRESQQRSEAAGPPSNDVPAATYRERDWKEAATGHGRAAAIPPGELTRLEKSSAPGARLDGGAVAAAAAGDAGDAGPPHAK